MPAARPGCGPARTGGPARPGRGFGPGGRLARGGPGSGGGLVRNARGARTGSAGCAVTTGPRGRAGSGRTRAGSVRGRRGGHPGGRARRRGDAELGRRTGRRNAGLPGLFGDGVLLDFDLQVEQSPDRLFLDAVHHGVEHVKALTLVLHQRVPLRHGAQADALAQVIHLVQVLAPLTVQDGQHDLALEYAHDVGRQLLLAALVRVAGVLGDHLGDQVRRQARLVAGLLDHVVHGDGDREQLAECFPQLVQVPFLREALAGGSGGVGLDDLVGHPEDLVLKVSALQHLVPLVVDDLALAVEHVVVLEDVLADLEVLLLHLGLGRPDGPRDYLGFDRHVGRDIQSVHDRRDPVRVEHAHQVVFERQVEARPAGVTLAAGPATKLVVDAPRLVPLSAQHVEAAGRDDLLVLLGHGLLGLGHRRGPGRLVGLRRLQRGQLPLVQLQVRDEVRVAAEHDVGTTSGHVRRHGDRALAPGHGHDRRLTLVVLGVQHLVRHAAALEHRGENLRLLHAGGAHEHRLALTVPLHDVLDARLKLGGLRLVNHVGLVGTDHRHVGRDGHDAELVDLVELIGFGDGRTGYAAELFVEPEVVLQGDRRERLILVLDLHAFLGLDGLVHALVVTPAVQDAAGELVPDEDLAVHHDVVLVLLVPLLGLDRVVEEADQGGVHRVVQVVDAEGVLDLLHPGLQDANRLLLLIDLVVALAVLTPAQPRRDLGELRVPPRALLGGAADDQRGPRLVDEDRVHLVYDREIVATLHTVVQAPGHVVAQVVEAELVVGAVGHVGRVLLAALLGLHLGKDHAYFEAEELVHPAHPLGVALGQVVVDRDDVHAVAGQRVQVGRQHGGQGLALTGPHLGDVAQVHRGAAHELDVEVALAQRALGSLADGGERLRHQLVQRLAVGAALPELVGHAAQLGVAHRDEIVLDGVDLPGNPLELAKNLAFASTKDAVDDDWHFLSRSSRIV